MHFNGLRSKEINQPQNDSSSVWNLFTKLFMKINRRNKTGSAIEIEVKAKEDDLMDEQTKEIESEETIKRQWTLLADIIERILFYIIFISTTGIMFYIIFEAPNVII